MNVTMYLRYVSEGHVWLTAKKELDGVSWWYAAPEAACAALKAALDAGVQPEFSWESVGDNHCPAHMGVLWLWEKSQYCTYCLVCTNVPEANVVPRVYGAWETT